MWSPLEPRARKQLGDSMAAFDAHAAAERDMKRYAGSLAWEVRAGGDFLVKTAPDGRLHDFGPRSLENEHRLAEFLSGRRRAQAQLDESLRRRLSAEPLNRTTQANRVASVVIGILNALQDQGLSGCYRVIGTHALLAYETAAGVVFDQEVTSTNDVDLLWDVQKRMKVVRALEVAGMSMVQLLQGVDPTFARVEDQIESAMNGDGFVVDFLRRGGPPQDSPLPISGIEGDVYPVIAERAQDFMNAAPFEQIVVGVDGGMARMCTVPPAVFVSFKRWMCELPGRGYIKQGRDRKQATAVQSLIDEGLL